MELLDIVNTEDQVIGQAARSDIHAQGLLHRACHMLLFNTAGQVFLQKRSKLKDESPGLWDSSAAGHVDSGEQYLSCAVRELEEELGLRVEADALTLLFKLPPRKITGMEFASVYSLISDAPLTLDPDEIDEGIWLDSGEVEQWMANHPDSFSVVFQEIWRKLQA